MPAWNTCTHVLNRKTKGKMEKEKVKDNEKED